MSAAEKIRAAVCPSPHAFLQKHLRERVARGTRLVSQSTGSKANKNISCLLECGVFRGGCGDQAPQDWAGRDLRGRAAAKGGMWAQPAAGVEVPLAQRPVQPPRPSWAPRSWLPGFGCLAPGSWGPGFWTAHGPGGRAVASRKENLCSAARPLFQPALPQGPRSGYTLSLPQGKEKPMLRWAGETSGDQTQRPALGGGRGRWARIRTARPRPRPLFRRAGFTAEPWPLPPVGAARSRERGSSKARAVGPPRAWPRLPVPAARPPCLVSTTSSWRSPSDGCCAHCAGSPCASLCRFPPAATVSATPACRSSSGAGRGPGASGGGAGRGAPSGEGLGPGARRAFVCAATL